MATLKPENIFLIKPKARTKLLNMDIAADFQKNFKSSIGMSVVLALLGIVCLLIGLVFWFFFIVAIIVFALIPLLGSARKKQRADHPIKVEKFIKRHGSYDEVVGEIKAHLKDEALPTYHISSEGSEFYIIGEWYVDTHGRDIVHISEIVAIVGIMGKGTFLILDDGTTKDVMFGPDTWGTVFELFRRVNPYVLYSDDEIALPDGKTGDVRFAFNTKRFESITKAYNEKKEMYEKYKPFIWMQDEEGEENYYAILLYMDGDFKQEIFDQRAEEGALGNGYDWTVLAEVFIKEKMPEAAEVINFDPEADMFCAYASDAGILETFVVGFREMCNDDGVMADLFSRAVLD
ncbi:MAG: immunity 51 family protein [Defluviitaleaceae bacterium]|nr:immunity 51 family protein [Defluviitaleaceae bacterium]